ncbi:unnamed protein product [Parnassius apollo]|uniref:(apollo) hypothetical protein n=1 Tax=Parnassius apollo TaxID=110799 RepID=A0A8S3W6M4_PARAO|nr:unnamed protein product [Parnassius apollo]
MIRASREELALVTDNTLEQAQEVAVISSQPPSTLPPSLASATITQSDTQFLIDWIPSPGEVVPSSDENATAEDAAPQIAEQPANVDAADYTPVVVDSNDDGTVTQELELEHMRSTLEEAIVETRSTPLENRPRLPRIALCKRNRAVVRALNPMLVTYLQASRDLCETNSILFGAALAVCRIIGA